MNCRNCGAFLSDTELEYCPRCGSNILIQKKIDFLSKYYYNQGLEKASIRDLSGAIDCLKQSLTYNKANIQARNLLGLVYFETGEVVAALSEWVISKNLMPTRNLASEYINKLQANPNKLEAINETIKKYNHALALCREGHEDMASIKLKKILSQNSKLIKGYHLLALIQIKEKDWNRARRTLKKAARIDKTNTTTLRFLREIDEQTGVTTRLEQKAAVGLFRGLQPRQSEQAEDGLVVHPTAYREKSKTSVFFTLALGCTVGALAFWLLAVPAIRQNIYKEANQQIIRYSESLVSQGAELSKAQGEAQASVDTAEAASKQIETEKRKSQSYESLIVAYNYLQQGDADSAALEIQKVYKADLAEGALGIYNTVVENTGVTGIEGEETQGDSASDESAEGSTGWDGSETDPGYTSGGESDGEYYEDGYGEEEYYDESSYDESYDEGYYDSGYYDESYYDENYYGEGY